jgi:hypothetical protein
MISWAWVVLIAIVCWYWGYYQAQNGAKEAAKRELVEKLEENGIDPSILD